MLISETQTEPCSSPRAMDKRLLESRPRMNQDETTQSMACRNVALHSQLNPTPATKYLGGQQYDKVELCAMCTSGTI